MNSTLKSLLFWMALVVLGVLIWNFSTKFQTHERQATFTEFMQWVDSGNVSRVTITGQDISDLNSGMLRIDVVHRVVKRLELVDVQYRPEAGRR